MKPKEGKQEQTKSKLEMFASPLKAKNNFIKASFGGFAGSGKTFTAAKFIIGIYKEFGLKKPLLILDNEQGSRFLIQMFKENGITAFVKNTTSLPDMLEAMELLRSGEIDFLFVDSLTKIWYQFVRDYKEANKRKFMELLDWGKILPVWQEKFSDVYVKAEGNIIFTGRGGFEYQKEEDTKNESGQVTKKGSFVKSGVKMKLAGETPFEPDLNIWMDSEQEIKDGVITIHRTAQIMKDRSNLIDGKIFENPTYKDFQPVVKFIMAQPIGEVKGETDTTNLSPSENYEWYREKEQREIKVEEIKGQFDMYGFGTSKEDKQLKATITEKIFGTTSASAFEKLKADELSVMVARLKIVLRDLAHADHNPEIKDLAKWKLGFVNTCAIEYLDSEIAKIGNPLAE